MLLSRRGTDANELINGTSLSHIAAKVGVFVACNQDMSSFQMLGVELKGLFFRMFSSYKS